MNQYQQSLDKLNAAQRQAVETTDGPVLVIAGPGTGKTQLLTTRIAHILASTDTLPQNILCLTFTDSAAQTMRERLSNLIGQAAYSVSISTYHAFGSELIRRFPDYFLEDSELQPIDDLGIDGIFREIIATLPYSNPLKYAETYLGDIKTLVSDAKRALLTPDNLTKMANDNLKFIAAANPVVSETLSGMLRVDKKSIPLFETIFERVQGIGYTFDADSGGSRVEDGADRQMSQMFTSSLEEAVAQAEETGKTPTITAWKNKWLAKDAEGQFIVDGAKTNQKLLAAAEVYQAYLNQLKARGLFDYDDMILRAVHALETNDDLRYSLQEQYLYIMLDEFQDTNGAQLRLVELLTDNPASEGRPNVLAVGDDDQAIYAFQGADYSHMLKFKDLYRNVLPVPLTQNYRSHANILHTARGVAEQIEERLHHHFPAIEKTLSAVADNLPAKATIERRQAGSDVEQFAWVAKRIRQLIDKGLDPSEIAVLAPQHKYLEPLVPFLQQADIPVRYEKRENVLDDPGINQLLRMSELVLSLQRGDHQAANALWPQVLSFDFWQLPTSLIWRLSWQASDDRQNWADQLLSNDKLQPIALFFIRLSQLAGTETLETITDYLIGSTPLDLKEPGHDNYSSPYYKHYFGDLPGSANFWSLLSNLIVLRARLREYKKDVDEPLTLEDLITFAQAHRDSNLKILNSSPYVSANNAVQLMTAFKAKGMEFTAVFVLAVNDDAWGSSARGQSSRISLPPNLQHIRYAGANDDERLRLFYVAITRAKSRLYLLNYTANYAGKTLSRLRYLNETAGPDGTVQSPLLPQGYQTVLPTDINTPQAEPTTELAAYWQHRHQTALSSADVKAILQDRLKTFQLSPTNVCDFIDVANCGPQQFLLRTILRFPQAMRPEVQYGNAMHETLEWVHNASKKQGSIPNLKQVLTTFSKRLADKRLNHQTQQLFLDRGQQALTAYLQQRGHTILATNVAEYNFRNEGVMIGKAHLSGKIDKLIIDPKSKTIAIVDYKTGKSHSRWTHEIKLHKYQRQLYMYKALVEGSHAYAGYKVTDAYLEFVEPDEDGKIQELHLHLDEDEYKKTKQLAEIIWQHIHELNLPDTASYPATIAGLQIFEEDLLMGTL